MLAKKGELINMIKCELEEEKVSGDWNDGAKK